MSKEKLNVQALGKLETSFVLERINRHIVLLVHRTQMCIFSVFKCDINLKQADVELETL